MHGGLSAPGLLKGRPFGGKQELVFTGPSANASPPSCGLLVAEGLGWLLNRVRRFLSTLTGCMKRRRKRPFLWCWNAQRADWRTVAWEGPSRGRGEGLVPRARRGSRRPGCGLARLSAAHRLMAVQDLAGNWLGFSKVRADRFARVSGLVMCPTGMLTCDKNTPTDVFRWDSMGSRPLGGLELWEVTSGTRLSSLRFAAAGGRSRRVGQPSTPQPLRRGRMTAGQAPVSPASPTVRPYPALCVAPCIRACSPILGV